MALQLAQLNQVPAIAQQAPEVQETPFDREINQLRASCLNKHAEKGEVVSTILGLAVTVAAIWVGIMANSILLALAIYFIAGTAVSNIYHGLRNSDYKDARSALGTPSFKHYIQRTGIALSIDSIVNVHKEYKKHVVAQAGQLAQARV